MNVESVRLKRTLKAGNDIWLEGTVFPNENCPSIPDEIMREIMANRPTVDVSYKEQGGDSIIQFVSKPIFENPEEQTTLSASVITSNYQEGDEDGKRKNQSRSNNTEKEISVEEKPKRTGLVRRK